MKYFITVLLCLALAGISRAEDAADQWGNWDELPDNVLNIGEATTAEELSRQLDKLIQQNPDSPEIDRLLELWLEQSAGHAHGKALPFQVLMNPDRGPPGLADHPLSGGDRHRELLEQLLENRPVGAGQGPAGAGSPSAPAQGSGSAGGSVNEDIGGPDF